MVEGSAEQTSVESVRVAVLIRRPAVKSSAWILASSFLIGSFSFPLAAMASEESRSAAPAETVAVRKPNKMKRILGHLIRHKVKASESKKTAETEKVDVGKLATGDISLNASDSAADVDATRHMPAVIAFPSDGTKPAVGVNVNGTPIAAPPTAADKKVTQSVNTVTGSALTPDQLAPPAEDPPIKGFHPIKRIMQPVEKLAKQSVQLGQQVMRLEGPIAGLQSPMLQLRDNMVSVQGSMSGMQGSIKGMQGSVSNVRGDMHTIGGQIGNVRGDLTNVRGDLTAVRSDLSGMRARIGQLEKPIRELKEPIVSLNKPIQAVAQPVTGVQHQLLSVEKELGDLKMILGTILASIYLAAGAIAIGTPVAAVVIYRKRRQLFPNAREKDFPVVASSETKSSAEKANAKKS
jgi:hypothetical protein